jgi:Ca-activated chloride channel family protein
MNEWAFHFLRPWWWLALLPAAALLLWQWRQQRPQSQWQQLCDAELLPLLLTDAAAPRQRQHWLLTAFMLLLAIAALAGPTWQRLPGPVFRNESALVVALDVSPTLDATDIKPSRLAKARFKIADLLRQRKDGQTALLVYGGDAFTVTPLTRDSATITSQLSALTTAIMPSPGRNTANAISHAADLLRQAGVAQGHILLVTDGVEADFSAPDSAGYRLSVLAVGSADGAPIPQAGGGFVKDRAGAIVVPRLDAAALTALAQHGGGRYQAVSDDDRDVEQLGALFNQPLIESPEADANGLHLQQWQEQGPWLLLLIVPWVALRFRKGLLLALLCCGLPWSPPAEALDWHSLWQNRSQQAQQAFSQQQYQQAAEQFDDPQWRAAAQYKAGQYQQAAETLKDSTTADGLYNRGNALAQTGQLQQALAAYDQALQREPQHADARYNRELVQKKLQEQQQQQQHDNEQANDQPQQQPPSDQNQPSKPDDHANGQPSQSSSTDKPQPSQDDTPAEAQPPKASESPKASDAPAKPKPEPADDAQTPRQQPLQKPEQPALDQADQQLLKRIPEEPAGLLKRKFRYQYGQRAPPKQ